MSMLAINGIELPIARDTYKAGKIEIGASGRAFSGAAWKSVRAVKRTASFTSAPLTMAEADAWDALLNGRFANWDFETDLYSLQGHAATADDVMIWATQKKFGAKSMLFAAPSATPSISWSLALPSAWSVAFWYFDSQETTFQHCVKTSAGLLYVNGEVTTGSYIADLLSVTGGVLAFLPNTYLSESYYVDDLFALPAVVPASWPAAMAAHGAQLVAGPSFTAAGDALGSAVVMQARALEREPVEVSSSVLWRLSVEMEEA